MIVKSRLATLRITMVVCGCAVAVGEPQGSTTKSPSWLDSAPRNWNRAGTPVPAAPKSKGESPATCPDVLKRPNTSDELAISRAGWFLFGSTSRGGVTVVQALLGFDGMCRPDEYQAFIFVYGKFAGTLSPVLMHARLDGALRTVSIDDKQGLVAEFSRYGPSDPLCCPSAVSRVEYEVRNETGNPVLAVTKLVITKP